MFRIVIVNMFTKKRTLSNTRAREYAFLSMSPDVIGNSYYAIHSIKASLLIQCIIK